MNCFVSLEDFMNEEELEDWKACRTAVLKAILLDEPADKRIQSLLWRHFQQLKGSMLEKYGDAMNAAELFKAKSTVVLDDIEQLLQKLEQEERN